MEHIQKKKADNAESIHWMNLPHCVMYFILLAVTDHAATLLLLFTLDLAQYCCIIVFLHYGYMFLCSCMSICLAQV